MRHSLERSTLVFSLLCAATCGNFDAAFGQSEPAPAASPLVVDGSILPFPPTPSASTAGLTMEDSIYSHTSP